VVNGDYLQIPCITIQVDNLTLILRYWIILFSDYPSQAIWKVELTVSLTSTLLTNETYQGKSSMQIYVNFPPLPGICTVSPTEGNTTSLFTISCNSWTDPDGSINNYAFYGKKKFDFLLTNL
jgi:hypothetical protein